MPVHRIHNGVVTRTLSLYFFSPFFLFFPFSIYFLSAKIVYVRINFCFNRSMTKNVKGAREALSLRPVGGSAHLAQKEKNARGETLRGHRVGAQGKKSGCI